MWTAKHSVVTSEIEDDDVLIFNDSDDIRSSDDEDDTMDEDDYEDENDFWMGGQDSLM